MWSFSCWHCIGNLQYLELRYTHHFRNEHQITNVKKLSLHTSAKLTWNHFQQWGEEQWAKDRTLMRNSPTTNASLYWSLPDAHQYLQQAPHCTDHCTDAQQYAWQTPHYTDHWPTHDSRHWSASPEWHAQPISRLWGSSKPTTRQYLVHNRKLSQGRWRQNMAIRQWMSHAEK